MSKEIYLYAEKNSQQRLPAIPMDESPPQRHGDIDRYTPWDKQSGVEKFSKPTSLHQADSKQKAGGNTYEGIEDRPEDRYVETVAKTFVREQKPIIIQPRK